LEGTVANAESGVFTSLEAFLKGKATVAQVRKAIRIAKADKVPERRIREIVAAYGLTYRI
jgi:hypothetical protein